MHLESLHRFRRPPFPHSGDLDIVPGVGIHTHTEPAGRSKAVAVRHRSSLEEEVFVGRKTSVGLVAGRSSLLAVADSSLAADIVVADADMGRRGRRRKRKKERVNHRNWRRIVAAGPRSHLYLDSGMDQRRGG